MTTNRNNDLEDYIKTVAKLIFIMVMLFLFLSIVAGCSAKKTVTSKTDERTEVRSESMVNGITLDERWWARYIGEHIESNSEIDITIYDTRLPADPATKRPPIVSDIHKKASTTTDKLERDSAGFLTLDVMAETTKDSANHVVMEDSRTESEKKAGYPSWHLYMFIGVMAICIVSALWGKHLIQDAAFYLLNKIFR